MAGTAESQGFRKARGVPMARLRKSRELGSIEARRGLKARPEPYYQKIQKGLALGYRKSATGGAWIARRYDPVSRRNHEYRIATADDHADADGTEVLNHAQAQDRAKDDKTLENRRGSGQLYTVADAVRDYVEHVRADRKSADDTETKLKAYVISSLGDKRLADLKPADFDHWRAWALKRPSRGRVKASRRKAKAEGKPAGESAEQQRRRKATLNRVIASFKACLNYAYGRKRIASRDAWAGLKKYRSVDSARLRWLTEDEAIRLLNAAAPDLRLLIRAGLLTGCREGELLAARARDFDSYTRTLLIPDSKSGKARRVPLTDEGVALFKSLVAGKLEDAAIFTRDDGSAWYRVAIIRGLAAACKGGKVAQPVTFYTLRHTYASHLVQKGTPLLFVADALGHRDVRMVSKHYGHFAPSQVAETIRANLPSFGTTEPSNVQSIR